jgi:hypothetical protein
LEPESKELRAKCEGKRDKSKELGAWSKKAKARASAENQRSAVRGQKLKRGGWGEDSPADFNYPE